ncbi:biotin-dependent carboxylase uncharacterized domain-containing protein [Gramella sp. MAR_2010_147]|nr:biotin-dependent carboxylase uncharacterized domain-containing protein [Gramella sp. MAR_2010_147]
MKAEIEVLQPGLFSTIQDLGRFGFQKFGVPHSGVMDRYAMRISNLILGNPEDASVMEITMQGPQLKFYGSTSICISGADISPELNEKPLEQNSVIEINKGDVLKFKSLRAGFRCYLAIAGGFTTEILMDSQSWYEGLTACFRLKKGMKLAYISKPYTKSSTHSSLRIDSDYIISKEIEVYRGPEFEELTVERQKGLFDSKFTVEETSNRMAVQFKKNFKNDLQPIITGPVMPGTVQLTPSGKIIALMRDCQTTGGYPRILQLSEKGIQVLSQKKPGEEIRFIKKEYPSFNAK